MVGHWLVAGERPSIVEAVTAAGGTPSSFCHINIKCPSLKKQRAQQVQVSSKESRLQ